MSCASNIKQYATPNPPMAIMYSNQANKVYVYLLRSLSRKPSIMF